MRKILNKKLKIQIFCAALLLVLFSVSGVFFAQAGVKNRIVPQYVAAAAQSNENNYIDNDNIPPFGRTDNPAAAALRSAVSIRCRFDRGGTPHTAAGSGVIYRLYREEKAAYIITNYHVVYDMKSSSGISRDIRVYVYGGEGSNGAEAYFVGGSLLHDIAVLKTSDDAFFTDSVKSAEAGDSNFVFAGDKVIAAGNANGGGLSVTAGIVSVDSEYISMAALADPNKTRRPRVIRIDAAVNGGNSGGGLYNSHGLLIGIVNAKTVAAGIEGICYAIPSRLALSVADCVIDNAGKRCSLGMEVEMLSSKGVYSRELNCIAIEEVLCVSCIDASSLAAKGFAPGDVLVSVAKNGDNEYRLMRGYYLPEFMLTVRAGDTLNFRVLRANKEVKFKLKIAEKDLRELE